MTKKHLEITGGAGPSEAAALAAVVQRILLDEEIVCSRPRPRPVQNPWVLSARSEVPDVAWGERRDDR